MTNGDTSSHDEYLPVEAVAARLHLSVRQATCYAERVRTLKKGRRIYYHCNDVEAVADELNVEERVPLPPRTEMMQTFELQQRRYSPRVWSFNSLCLTRRSSRRRFLHR